MFNYVYLLGIRNRLEENVRKSFGSKILVVATNPDIRDSNYESNIDMNDDDMSRLQKIAPDDYMDYRRDLPMQERDVFQFPIERDYSEWLYPYEEREMGLPDEYPFQDFNYGP